MFYYVITLALDYIVFIILRFCFLFFMTVYKNIYFVPSFLFIPQIFWYSVWFLISERTRDYCLISFYLAYSLLTTVHTRFCLYSFAHIHMYQKSAFFSYKHYANFPAGGEYFPAMWTPLLATQWTTQLKTNETFMNVPKKLQMQQSVCVFMCGCASPFRCW